MRYNVVRLRSKLRTSHSKLAGVTDRLWEIADTIALVEAGDTRPAKCGPSKCNGMCDAISPIQNLPVK